MTSNLSNTAKILRKNSTQAERLIWNHLRARQLSGIKFRRQQPIGHYIVDFITFEKRIIVELDGGQHSSTIDKDRKRDEWFKKKGFCVLRFWNNEVFENLEGVLETIRLRCLQ